MQPLGRKHFKPPSQCKHKVKENGKHIEAWWEDRNDASKTTDKQASKKAIREEVAMYE